MSHKRPPRTWIKCSSREGFIVINVPCPTVRNAAPETSFLATLRAKMGGWVGSATKRLKTAFLRK